MFFIPTRGFRVAGPRRDPCQKRSTNLQATVTTCRQRAVQLITIYSRTASSTRPPPSATSINRHKPHAPCGTAARKLARPFSPAATPSLQYFVNGSTIASSFQYASFHQVGGRGSFSQYLELRLHSFTASSTSSICGDIWQRQPLRPYRWHGPRTDPRTILRWI